MNIFLKLSRCLKLRLLLIFCFACPVLLKAQTPEPVIAKVYYKFSHQYDTTDTHLVKKENYVLLLGKESEVYKSYDKVLRDSVMMAEFKRSGSMAPPSGAGRVDNEELYYFFISQKSFLRVSILGNYIIEKPYNDLKWSISGETKLISNLSCQKATTTYMGREYTAWFTTSLPFHGGPWKLHGLPGLIVSAYDKTGRISFEFAGFEQVANSKLETYWDKKCQMITWEDYKKIAKAAEDDPEAFLEKRFGGTFTHSTPLPHRNILAPSKYVNFPLEIESKNAVK